MAGGLMSSEAKPPIDISGSGSKGPGALDPDEDRKKLMAQRYGGEKGSSKGGGGGSSWTPAIVAIVVSVIASAVMVFIFSPTPPGLNTLSDQIIELDNRSVMLENQGMNTNGRIETILSNSVNYVTQDALTGLTDGMATDAELSSLQSSIDSLTSENSALVSRIDALEVVKEEEEEAATSPEDVRWDFRTPKLLGFTVGKGAYDETANPDGDGYSTETPRLKVEHFRIDESGSYEFYLRIGNTDDLLPSKADGSVNIELTLSSDRGDALLNDSSTYIYTDEMPNSWFDVAWIDWDDGDFTTVTKGNTDITRRVDFETENFSIPSLDSGESVEFDLVLELYYE